jgi:DNA-binding LytR/AlgR family response regulator
MKLPPATALIADDEPLLREALQRLLTQLWPELQIVAAVRNGRAAVESFEALKPDVCFLDVHMPGLSGIEAARFIGRRAHIVFVTAFDHYAVQAFDQGALDYLIKPIEHARLADTVMRLKSRLLLTHNSNAPTSQSFPDTDALLERISATLLKGAPSVYTRWLRVAVGRSLRIIAVEEIDFLRAEDKYVSVVWHEKNGHATHGLIRTPLNALTALLDPDQFVQSHRAVVVNLAAIDQVRRGAGETAIIHLKNHPETLPVSRTFLHHFRMM